MKCVIIGAGASGIAAAINIKRKYPNDEVIIIEHSDRPLRKILATGNGRCNLGNAKFDIKKYNHPELMGLFSYNDYIEYVESYGFKTKTIGDLVYPYSESAQTVRNQMLKELEKLNVKINLEEDFIDYKVKPNGVEIKTNKAIYQADKLIVATGGKSTKGLGNDGKIYEILKSHGYTIAPLRPGLVPIKTKENTKLVDGLRIKANVTLLENSKQIFNEDGEVLFKKDGLSGIVIFNASNYIKNPQNKYEIVLNLLPDFNGELQRNHQQFLDKSKFLEEYFAPKLAQYLSDRISDKNYVKDLQNLKFTFKDFYDYENSQITIGGVQISDMNPNFESKKEPNVYFLGELLDMHGPCGGYNLTWAFICGQKLMS
ncbi:MAG: aminoacetone oxidase family FAD-binding enzyme [Bacilli bacterium]|nr:aminoacetone oxidase family FAD-binding enzyme [Bacilli bacterium]